MKQYFKRFAKLAVMLVALVITAGALGMKAEAAASYLHPYAKASYEKTDEYYSLKVDGKSVDVVTYFEGRGGEIAYAHLAYEGTATFEITNKKGNFGSYNLSPHSYGFNETVSGNKITFNLTQKESRYIILQSTINGSNKILVIACDPQKDYDKYLNGAKKVVNVVDDYGADPTWNEFASDKIQKAINDVSSAGGGVVIVPKGVYKIIYIDGRDNVTLYLQEGAVLRGCGDYTKYTWGGDNNGIQGRRDLDIKNSKNFKVVGPGMIDGNSIALVRKDDGSAENVDGWDNYRKGIVDGNGASGFIMDGVTVKDSAGWTFSVAKSSDITIQNVKLLADWKFIHTDGYDFTSCNGVYIGDCLGVCGDDVFCPKAQHEGATMTDYLIENGVAFAHGGAGCKVGMQARCYTDNIVFRNIDVVQGYRGFTVAHDTGSADWSNIVFENIRTEKLNTHTGTGGQFRAAPFVIWTYGSSADGAIVDGVTVNNCSFESFNSKYMALIQGNAGEDAWVKNVTINNLKFGDVTVNSGNYTNYVTVGDNVTNLKFNASSGSTSSGSASSTTKVSYEAEKGALSNGAAATSKSIASGSSKVGNLGGDSNGTVRITVNSPVTGPANVEIYYITNGTRTFYVTANNGDAVPVVCEGDSWNEIQSTTVQLNLKAGSNTIKLDNGTGSWAPDLDRIVVETFQTKFEAENAALTDGAKVVSKDIASGGKIVGDVGGTDSNGTVTFTVNSPVAGKASLKINYLLNGNRTVYVTANSDPYFGVSCSGTNWNAVKSVTVDVMLKKGSNTIKLDNGSGVYAPNLDSIEVTFPSIYEAENGKLANGAVASAKSIASGGMKVGNVGGTDSNGTCTVYVDAPNAGTAYLDIYYICNGTRTVYVTTNSDPYFGVSCTGDSWNEIQVVTVEVELKAGQNKILLDNGSGNWAPDLDCIAIRMK